MTYAVEAIPETGGMACQVTATAKSGKYSIETEYVTDPGRNTVLMRVRFDPEAGGLPAICALRPDRQRQWRRRRGQRRRRLGHGRPFDRPPVLVASDPNTATNAANRDYAQPVYAALDGAFTEATSGFAGAASDGLVQLDASHVLTPTYDDALGGNVVQTAQVAVAPNGKAVLALGFGASQAEAVGTAEASLVPPFDSCSPTTSRGGISTTTR